jgi:hypothetical protein
LASVRCALLIDVAFNQSLLPENNRDNHWELDGRPPARTVDKPKSAVGLSGASQQFLNAIQAPLPAEITGLFTDHLPDEDDGVTRRRGGGKIGASSRWKKQANQKELHCSLLYV